MMALKVKITKQAAVIIAGFVFGILVLTITSINIPKADCGDTMAGLGCAINQFNKYISSIGMLLAITTSIIVFLLNYRKVEHSTVISVMGASSAISTLILYSSSYIFYESYIGHFYYSAITAILFYCSYVLCNKLIPNSKK